jgi:tetratricopeptide (TPR) repeat protein
MVFARPAQARAGARAVLAGDPSHHDASIAHQVLGLLERDFGDADAAIGHLRRAVRLAHRCGSGNREGDAMATLGVAFVHRGQTAAGLATLRKAVPRADGHTAARVRFRLAYSLWVTGQHRPALDEVRRAVPVLRRAGDQVWTARALTLRALVHLALGAADRADRDFRTAEDMFASTHQEYDRAEAVHNRGLVALRTGDLPAALARLDEAGARYRALGTPMPELSIDYCATLLAAGLDREALAEADAAIARLEARRGQATRRAELLLTAARAALATGDPSTASERARAACRLFAAQRRDWWAAHGRLLLLQSRLAAGGAGVRLRREAVRCAEQLAALGSDESRHARLLAGRAALASGRPAEAASSLAAAARARHRGPPLARVVGWLAEALRAEAAGATRRTLAACGHGLAVLRAHHLTLGAPELRAQATSHGAELAATAVRTCLRTGRPRQLLVWSERWRATALAVPAVRPAHDRALVADLTRYREVTSRLAAAAAGDTGQPGPATRSATDQPSRPALQPGGGGAPRSGAGGESLGGGGAPRSGAGGESLRREQRRLEQRIQARTRQRPGDRNRAAADAGLDVPALLAALGAGRLVEIVEVDGALQVLLCGGGAVRRFPAGTVAAVTAEVTHARAGLHRLAHRAAGRPAQALARLAAAGQRLEELLLGQSARHLGDGPVVVVPPGRLYAVPWPLLPSLRVRVVSVAPSARAWLRARSTAAVPPGRGVLAVRGPGLPAAGAETAAIAEMYEAATVFEGAAATAERVLAALDGCALAHLAAHGTFRADSPLFSALQLSDGPLTVHDLERLHRAPHRLVLPSCDSARLAPAGADELLGLTAALLPLGTVGLVASVVPVDDQATAELMLGLHRRLCRGATMAEALAAARAALPAADPVAQATGCSFLALGAG